MAEQKTTTTAKTAKTTAAKTTVQTSAETVAPVKPTSPAPSGGDANAVKSTGASTATSTSTTATATTTPTVTTESTVQRGKRLDVTLNVAVVASAFHNATSSRSVRYVQYALHDRGFEPGNDVGKVDFDTRKAYADFQRSVNESPTGVPTAYSLDILGFDVS